MFVFNDVENESSITIELRKDAKASLYVFVYSLYSISATQYEI